MNWTIVLDLLIFIVSLGFLVVVHELGHMSMAKLFKVYCYEFSIGMGPKLYQKKPNKEKGQETIFSIRALPVGGYVSMAGEDQEDTEGIDPDLIVPKERTLEAKPRWQRIIIMSAGVFVNFILGFCLFLIDYAGCPQTKINYADAAVEVYADTVASKAGLSTGDKIISIQQVFYNVQADGSQKQVVLAEGNKLGEACPVTSYALEETPSSYLDYNSTISTLMSGVYYTGSTKTDYIQISPANEGDRRDVTFVFEHEGTQNTKTLTTYAASSKAYFFSKAKLSWGSVGISATSVSFRYSFAEGWNKAWSTWCYGCSMIFSSLISLFNPATWSQLGGIVAIFEMSSIAAAAGIGTYIYLWGLISVNLAIVNLLPFPGLDGWHILVCLVEYVAIGIKKLTGKFKSQKAPQNLTPEEIADMKRLEDEKEAKRLKTYKKVKNIVSTVGLILLIILAVVLIVKDIVASPLG